MIKKKARHKTRFFNMAERTGLEPATPCVTGRYSNQLNYQTNLLAFCKALTTVRLQEIAFLR